MNRSREMARRLAMAANRFSADLAPQPSHSRKGLLRFASCSGEGEDVGRIFDQTLGEERLQVLFAQTFDIEGIAGYKVLEPLHRLRLAEQSARAALRDRAFLTHHFAVALGTGRGEAHRAWIFRPLVGPDFDHLWDDIAGALDDDGIADADIFAFDFVFVVQGGVADQNAAHVHGLEARHWRQYTRAPDLNLDRFEHRFRLLGGKLMGDGPARRAAHKTQPPLPVEAVDFVNHAIDVERQLGALGRQLVIGGQHLIDGSAELGFGRHRKAPALELLKILPVGLPRGFVSEPPGVGEQLQGARGGDAGVELAQGAGGGVARIGEDFGAFLGLCRIERGEVLLGHIDLAANLDQLRCFAHEKIRQAA